MGVVTIACVYRPGGGFTDEYVYRLRDGVADHCLADCKFVCLTNERLPAIECLPLLRNNRGFWNKLELFRKGALPGRVVYLDLDSVIVSNITDIVQYPHSFTAGCNWKYFDKGERIMNSGFLAWSGADDLSHMDQDIGRAVEEEYSQDFRKWGDQAWIQNHLNRDFTDIQSIFPGRYVSYKLHVAPKNTVPETASIVAFHGRPRPADIGWKLPL